jgi:phenylacetate-CoA ligase
MKMLAICADYWRLERAQWRDRDWLRQLQERKLRVLVEHAYRTVPFYRARFDAASVFPTDIKSLEDLARLPITTRAELQATSVEARTSSLYRPDTLVAGLTSGSTGRPFTIYRDPAAMRLRKSLFFRALKAAGYRFGDRILLLVYPPKAMPPGWLRWHYVTRDVPPEHHLRALNELRPAILYAMATTLRLLAIHIRDTGRKAHRPRVVIATGETLDGATRQILETTFGAPVFDVYGTVETGTIAWECAHHNGLHIAEDTAIIEFLSSAHGDVHRMVLTNFENLGMPQLRYEIGDLGVLAEDTPCPCGRSFRRLARIEGRLIDCIRLKEGRLVSPYRFERIIERIAGVERFQVVQERHDEVLVRLQGPGDPAVADAVRGAVESLIGSGIAVRTRWEPSLDPPHGRKFRLVECHVSPDTPS